jgi:predicted NUDIX family phosphoesterase
MKDQKLIRELKKQYKDEQVYVVPYDAVTSIQDGFTPMKDNGSIWSKFDGMGRYIYRYDAEYDPSFQQIIPYVIVQHDKTDQYLVSERIGGEPRLQGQFSLGFGGHINPEDGTHQVLLKAMARELSEELHHEFSSKADFLGYIRDFKSKTSEHLGCIFRVTANKCKVREIENLKGVWMSIDTLEQNYFRFEGWSQFIINHLVQLKYKGAVQK